MCFRLVPNSVTLNDLVQNRYIPLLLLCLTPPTEGFPWDDLHKMGTERSWMAKVPNGIEILPKINNRLSRAHERQRRQTTDRRQTDG